MIMTHPFYFIDQTARFQVHDVDILVSGGDQPCLIFCDASLATSKDGIKNPVCLQTKYKKMITKMIS
jgi:hypothetical protein